MSVTEAFSHDSLNPRISEHGAFTKKSDFIPFGDKRLHIQVGKSNIARVKDGLCGVVMVS